jgi:hypothetical protein
MKDCTDPRLQVYQQTRAAKKAQAIRKAHAAEQEFVAIGEVAQASEGKLTFAQARKVLARSRCLYYHG